MSRVRAGMRRRRWRPGEKKDKNQDPFSNMVPRLGCEPQAPSSLRSPLTDAPENNCPRGVLTSALTLTITIIISHMMRDRRLERPLRNPGLNVHPQSPVCVCACMYVCPHHFTDGCSGSPFYKDCCLSISSSSLSPPASLPPSLPRPSLHPPSSGFCP